LVLTRNAALPSAVGNVTAHAAKIEKPGTVASKNKAYSITFDSIKLQLFLLLTTKFYASAVMKIKTKLVDSKGVEQTIPYTEFDTINPAQANTWYTMTVNLAKYLKVGKYKGINYYIDWADSLNAKTLYIDSITFKGLTIADSVVISA
jgi:hypothetical protein